MTKEQKEKALAFLKDMQECTYDGVEEIRTAIESLEQQPCDDCVSRQAVKEGMLKYGFHAPDMTVTEFIEDELPSVTPKILASDDCVSRQAALDAITEIDDNINMDIYTNEVREIINELSSVRPTRKAPREDITEDEVKINMLELAFNQVKEQAESIEVLTDKYKLIFKAETRSNKVGWPSLENVREKVERGNSDGSN